MVKRFAEAGRPGTYLRVVTPGDVAAGDPVEVLSRPAHDVTVAIVSRAILFDDTLLLPAAAAPALSPALARWMRERAA